MSKHQALTEDIVSYFALSDQKRIGAGIRITRMSKREQYISISINHKAYRDGDITIEDIESFFSIYLAEIFNDDLAAYILEVDDRRETVKAKITDFMS